MAKRFTLVVTQPLIVSGKKVDAGFVFGHVDVAEALEGRDLDKALQQGAIRVDGGDLEKEANERIAKKSAEAAKVSAKAVKASAK